MSSWKWIAVGIIGTAGKTCFPEAEDDEAEEAGDEWEECSP